MVDAAPLSQVIMGNHEMDGRGVPEWTGNW